MSAEWTRSVTVSPQGRSSTTREWYNMTHSLTIAHRPDESSVAITHRKPGGTKSAHLLRRAGQWFAGADSGGGVALTHPPSEALQAMIRHYHKQDAGSAAWMPLLDMLAEEYPDHFADHVAEHTKARAGLT